MKLDLPRGWLVYQAGIKAALGSQDPNLYNIHSESLFCTKYLVNIRSNSFDLS